MAFIKRMEDWSLGHLEDFQSYNSQDTPRKPGFGGKNALKSLGLSIQHQLSLPFPDNTADLSGYLCQAFGVVLACL